MLALNCAKSNAYSFPQLKTYNLNKILAQLLNKVVVGIGIGIGIGVFYCIGEA